MEYINFYIILSGFAIAYFLYMKFGENAEVGSIFLIIASSVLLLFHTIFFFGERGNHYEFMYDIQEYHRKSELLTQKQKDSLNDEIHRYKYSNEHFWMSRQYIPDEVDTLTYFK